MKRDRKNCISRKGAKSVEERISFAGLASWRDKVFDHSQQHEMLEINSHTSESKNLMFVAWRVVGIAPTLKRSSW
jgi:uncharacterized protein YjlB